MTAPTVTGARGRKPAATESVDATLPAELVPTPAAPSIDQSFAMLPVSQIRPSKANPRRDLGDLEGLAASMRAVGVLEPLIVELESEFIHDDLDPTAEWALLAGHRRLAAAQLAGLSEVPCIIRSTTATPAQRMEMALVENLQREGLAPLDEADGYRTLVDLGLSQRAIADRVGCSQSHVSKRLALLELPTHVQARVAKGTLPLEAAAALVKLKDHPDKLKKAAGEDPSAIVAAVERAENVIAWEAKRRELVDVAKGKKWPVVAEPRDYWIKRSFATLAQWNGRADLELDVREHEAEPCHAVMIPSDPVHGYVNLRPPSATSVCTAPDRHKPKGASALKVKVAPAAKRELTSWEREQREQVKARKTASLARAAVIIDALAKHELRGRTTDTVRFCLAALVERVQWDSAAVACELLGLEVVKDGTGNNPSETIRRFAASGERELHRVALAASLAPLEFSLRKGYGSFAGDDVARHYAYLATLGYELSPWERAEFEKAAKARAGDKD